MMRTSVLAACTLAAALAPAAVPADPPAGRVETDQGRAEILSTPVQVGVRVELPEGWYRVEEAGDEDGQVGSFAVVPPGALAAAGAPAAEDDGADAGSGPASARPAPRSCRAERNAYVAELWRMQGIDVEDPVGLLAGVEGEGFAPWIATLALGISTDAFRPLAWSPALRDRAAALARCERGD